jgi:hypothetical protein
VFDCCPETGGSFAWEVNYPLSDCTRDRWRGIAAARQRGRPLPPVALIQVGDLYFVRDGHHRISVTRALGQHSIEATVEMWHTDRPLTREQVAPTVGRSRPRERDAERRAAAGSRPALALGWLSGLLQYGDRARASEVAR